MRYVSEDPTYLAGGLVLLAAALAIAMRVTQQGKYLLSAGTALLLALLVIVVEWLWVTDNERIEQVVHDVRTAVLNSDPEGVLAHLTPDAQYAGPESSMTPEATRDLIRNYVSNIHLEFIRIMQLQTSVAQQARRGTAEFRVLARGGTTTTSNAIQSGTVPTAWSLGFQETGPGIWKIYRISQIATANGFRPLSGGLSFSSNTRTALYSRRRVSRAARPER